MPACCWLPSCSSDAAAADDIVEGADWSEGNELVVAADAAPGQAGLPVGAHAVARWRGLRCIDGSAQRGHHLLQARLVHGCTVKAREGLALRLLDRPHIHARGVGHEDPQRLFARQARGDLVELGRQRSHQAVVARETGLALEAEDIVIRPVLPESCLAVETVDQFLAELSKYDTDFETMRADAEKQGEVLRMVARLEDGRAEIGLSRVGSEHPFYGLSGADNMIIFTTERYKERPLVVRGPGAGAEVTAAGIFAEIIKIANYL